MIKGRDLKYFALGAIIFTSSLSVWAAVSLPNTFKAGDTIKSSEVNENFSSLKAAIDALQVSSVLGDGSVTLPKLAISGTKADGKVLKLEAGNLTWGDDLIGAGGSSYSAGTGLSLTGTTFSVNTSAVQSRVTATCAAGSSIREILADGTVTCQTDNTGSSYTAGTGLSLTGTVLAANLAGSGTASTIARSDHNHFGQTWNGAGTAGLRVTNTTSLNAGSAIIGQDGTGTGLSLTGNAGVIGNSETGEGVVGYSKTHSGVFGRSLNGIGVEGYSGNGSGLVPEQITNAGVLGSSPTTIGVAGTSGSNFGVYGSSVTGNGIVGSTSSTANTVTGVTGINKNTGVNGAGVAGYHNGSGQGVFGNSFGGEGVYGLSTNGAAAKFVGGGGGNGNCYYNGGADWVCTSDRNKKEHFKTLDSRAMLEKFMLLPITRWNMKGDKKLTPHVGPMAQDFYALFGLGDNNVTINRSDAQGVTMKALQGLYSIVKEKDAKIMGLNSRVQSLEARLAALEKAFKSR
jgi:hypothetical protein